MADIDMDDLYAEGDAAMQQQEDQPAAAQQPADADDADGPLSHEQLLEQLRCGTVLDCVVICSSSSSGMCGMW
jgi:hypothetical protein